MRRSVMILRCQSLLLAIALNLSLATAAVAQAAIDGLEGFKWGTTRADIIRRLGPPREDVTDSGVEKISISQGPDSGYWLVIDQQKGLVGGVRILPLSSGTRCAAEVAAAVTRIRHQYPFVLSTTDTVADAKGGWCNGLKEWKTMWEDFRGNTAFVSTEGAIPILQAGMTRHRLYMGGFSAAARKK